MEKIKWASCFVFKTITTLTPYINDLCLIFFSVSCPLSPHCSSRAWSFRFGFWSFLIFVILFWWRNERNIDIHFIFIAIVSHRPVAHLVSQFFHGCLILWLFIFTHLRKLGIEHIHPFNDYPHSFFSIYTSEYFITVFLSSMTLNSIIH